MLPFHRNNEFDEARSSPVANLSRHIPIPCVDEVRKKIMNSDWVDLAGNLVWGFNWVKIKCLLNLHHDGIFIASPLRYVQGDLKQITDIDFKGIKQLKTDSDVQDFVRVGYENKLFVDFSDEIEEFDDIDFHTKGEENVVIKNLTTHDLFLNKLCGNNEMFKDYLDESVLETEGEALDDPDDAHIDPIHKAQKGVTYPKHDPTIPWNKMTPVLGMRCEHPEQLKQALANYGVANGY
ncbi:hypothetical protein Tco_0553902 [Tanacetum coccineum]